MELKEILDRATANLKSKKELLYKDWEELSYTVYYDAKNSKWTPVRNWAIKNNAMLEIEKQMDKLL